MDYIIIICAIVFFYEKIKAQIIEQEKRYNENLYNLQQQIDEINKRV